MNPPRIRTLRREARGLSADVHCLPAEVSLPHLAASTVSVLVLLGGGLYYFRAMETYFADLV